MTTLKELRERARGLGIPGASKMNTADVSAAIAAKEGQGELPPTDPREFSVAGSNGQVRISRSGDNVTVTWLCGARRTFTTEDLAAALERFTMVGERGLWYEDSDSFRNGWAAHLHAGQFHGDDHVNGASGHVPWAEFKAALEQSLS